MGTAKNAPLDKLLMLPGGPADRHVVNMPSSMAKIVFVASGTTTLMEPALNAKMDSSMILDLKSVDRFVDRTKYGN